MGVLCVLLTLSVSLSTSIAARTYVFQLRVAWFSLFEDTSTSNQLHFRLCHNALICTTFTNIPNGLKAYQTYVWNVSTPTDYGTINKIQIVHTGDDTLCISWVDVDGITYDASAPFSGECWESNQYLTACSTLTITSANDWSATITNPCEYASLFNITYNPTQIPSRSTFIPTKTPTTADDPQTTTDAHGDDMGTNHFWMWTGITFAVLFMCLLIVFMIYCYYHRKKLKKETNKSNKDHAHKINANAIVYEPVVDDCAPGAIYVDTHLMEGVKCDVHDVQLEGYTTSDVLLEKHSNDSSDSSDSEDLYDAGPKPKETPTRGSMEKCVERLTTEY